MFRLVLGTHNSKKLREMKQLLEGHPIELASLAEIPEAIEVDETGTTFFENAELKATQQAQHLQQWVLAEDSGLSVAALDGAPGVYSARFSGPEATDERNNQLLLERMQDVPDDKRLAWYTSTMALSDPQGTVRARAEGRCYGRVLRTPRGESGFGYDPLFELLEYHQTFAELGDTIKGVLSHRARAHRQLLPQLLALAAGQP